MFRILVCIKQVPDLDMVLPADWRAAQESGVYEFDYASRVINAGDENALELALRLREENTESETRLTVLTAGGPESDRALKTAHAVGADDCVRISAGGACVSDPWKTAAILADTARGLSEFDLMLFGSQAGVFDSGLTGFFVAERLGIPCIPETMEVHAKGGLLEVRHRIDEGIATSLVRGPAVLLCGTLEGVWLRMPTLKQKLAAKKREIRELAVPEPEETGGLAQLALRVPETGRRCVMLEGETGEEKARALVSWLRERGEAL